MVLSGGAWHLGSRCAEFLESAASYNFGSYPPTYQAIPTDSFCQIAHQRLELILNGKVIYSEKVARSATAIAWNDPEGLLKTEVNNHLVISHPDAVAPRDISTANTDSRPLAICVRSLELEHLAPGEGTTKESTPANQKPASQVPGDDRARALVLCFGNAICRELVQLLRSFPPFDVAFELRLLKRCQLRCCWVEFSLKQGSRSTCRHLGTDFQRPCKGQGRITDICPSRRTAVKFPTLTLNSLWPLEGDDPRSVPEPLYPGGRYPYTDIAAVHSPEIAYR